MTKILLLMLTLALFAVACGNKTEVNVKTQDTNKTLTTIPNQTNPIQQLPPTDSASKLKDNLNKQQDTKQIEDADKKKRDDEQKKKELEMKKENEKKDVTEIDFAPIFKKRCVKCHGSNGKGKVEGVPDLTLPKTQNKSDSQLFKIITNGVKGETEDDEDMPSFKNKLSDEERQAAVRFVKSLR